MKRARTKFRRESPKLMQERDVRIDASQRQQRTHVFEKPRQRKETKTLCPEESSSFFGLFAENADLAQQ